MTAGIGSGWTRTVPPLLLADFDAGEVAALAATAGVELNYGEAERLHAHTQRHPLWIRMLLVSSAQPSCMPRMGICGHHGRWRHR
jgi:hypothetical protein